MKRVEVTPTRIPWLYVGNLSDNPDPITEDRVEVHWTEDLIDHDITAWTYEVDGDCVFYTTVPPGTNPKNWKKHSFPIGMVRKNY